MAVNIDVHYTDPTSDPTKQPFTIVPGEVNASETPLVLSGQGAADYSTHVNENFLHLLENFSSPNPPLHPTIGQLWYSSDSKELRLLSDIGVGSGGERFDDWNPVGVTITTSTTVPSLTNRLWYDVSDPIPSNHQLKIYDQAAQQWQPVAKQWLVTGSTAPVNTSILWYNTSTSPHELYAYNTTDSQWHTVISHDAALLTGQVPDSVLANSNIGGNAATATLAAAATKLATGRSISITGGATATGGLFDGTADLAFNVTALNANVLTTGTVPLARIGASGTRTSGYYLDGSNAWIQMPYIPDAYTKTEMDTKLSNKLDINGTAVSANNVNGMTAADIINASYAKVGTMGQRDVYISTSDPVATTGVVGDVWFKF